ncbi:putative thionin [Dioscorea sansibarensis]
MEGKGVKVPLSVVVMVVLILGLNLAQTHVEAKSCCPTTTARNCYNVCRLTGASRETCAKLCGCIIVPGTTCPPNYPSLHFCESGCASSMCSTISTLENSDDAENTLVACKNKCSELCNKNFVEDSNEVITA